MPRDPRSKRREPAPDHPKGFPAIDDGPVFIAPPIDVRPAARARTVPPPAPPEPSERGKFDDVSFSLHVPAEERASTPERSSRWPVPMGGDAEADEPAPETRAFDRDAPPRISRGSITPPPPAMDAPSGEREEYDALVNDLMAIGNLDERPDRDIERTVGARATLARARALRFRLALLDAWPLDSPGPSTSWLPSTRALHLDLTIDAALLVMLADGAPSDRQPLGGVRVLAEALCAVRHDLPRIALRDRGASAIARLTIIGYRAAFDQMARQAIAVPPEARLLALEIGARVARVPSIDDYRLSALSDLERALSLPTGTVAHAIDSARRPS